MINSLIMTNAKRNNIPGRVITVVLFVSCFSFFAFFYQYHVYFTEQLQIFQMTFSHFLNYFSKPAFFASYSGDFLTQFYYLTVGGAVVITLTLAMLWFAVSRLLKKISNNNPLILFTVLPVVFSWIALCSMEFPVSNLISLILSVFAANLYLSILSRRNRFVAAIFMLPLLYITAGSNFYLLAIIAACFEIYTINPGKIYHSLLLCAITIFVPLALKNHYLLTTGQAFTYLSEMNRNPGFKHFLPLLSVLISVVIAGSPLQNLKLKLNTLPSVALQLVFIIVLLVTGFRLNADFTLEKILKLDFEASHDRWSKVYELSQKYKMHNKLSAYYTNMALSKLGYMSDSLMEYYQPAATGLFIPVNANENYMTITFSNEIYWQLGDINASQHSALLGMIFSPRAQNVRLMKRLVEINIVNRQYAAAEKFIGILGKTMFYRKWASDRRKFLFNEEECSRSNWITDKRAIIPSKDLLKKGNEYVRTLRMLADNHPENKMAVDYLLCYHLLIKDIPSFVKDFDKYYSSFGQIHLPEVYQEGLLIRIVSGESSYDAYKQYRFSPDIVKRMTEYTRKYEENNGKGNALQKEFGTTYWFYYHFATLTSE
jgi:hypothetical protein